MRAGAATVASLFFISFFLSALVPPLLLEAGAPPAAALLAFPLALASFMFLAAHFSLEGTARAVVPSILAMFTLQVPALMAVGAKGLPIIGRFIDPILNFLKFVAALAFMGFAFMLLCGVSMLGKPGAFIAAVGSLALASALAFERALPLGVGGAPGVDLGRLAMAAVLASAILLFVVLSAHRGRAK